MAIGWLTVLQTVPWSEVIRNAPKVAEGARKLWHTVAGKPVAPEPAPTGVAATVSPEARSITAMESRLAAMEAAVTDLHGQMLASSELIKVLADQNAQLIKHIESNRRRVFWLTIATVVAVLVAVASLVSA